MSCQFKEISTHYLSSKGNIFSKEQFQNGGRDVEEGRKKELPVDEYPYTYLYRRVYPFGFCETCNCKK